MANVIKLRKGLDINLKGKAAETYTTVKEPGFYALVPDDFPGVTPKVVVKEQEYVMAGGPLFIDKYHPEVKFVSPVSGVVTSVERGARRKVLNIVVEAAAEQDYEEFGKKNVSSMDADAVKSALLEAGLFAFIKQRPYDIIADPTVTPKGIFVSAFDTNPLAPDFEFALKGEEANFQTGLDALAKMAKTYLSISVKQKAAALTQAKNVTITAFDGPNPAGNVGVQINHLDPVSKGETVWTIDPQAVIFIGRLFNTGRVNFTRTVAVTGSEVLKPAYCKLQVGALLTNVFAGNVTTDKDLRYISGNVLSGKQVSPNGFLGAFHSQLTVIPEGDDVHEMFGWIMPRFNQFSANHSYFSWLMGKKEYTLDARIKGGERHMIMSGEYDKVFPMDIMPEYLIKAIIAGDIDRMEALGIYEVAPEDFAFQSVFDGFETFLFVPSKTAKTGTHIHDAIDSKRIMSIVVISLVPALLFGMYNVGYQHFTHTGATGSFIEMFIYGFLAVLPKIIVSYVVGLGIEFVVAQWKKEEIQEGFLVSGILIPMIVPVDCPLWILAVATAFSVIFAKEVFGGTGMNVFNVALITRAFLFFAYPTKMSGDAVWVSGDTIFGMGQAVDGLTVATPLGQAATSGTVPAFNMDMITGLIPGSIGETSVIAILIGAVILLWTGVASWKTMLSVFVGGAFMAWVFNAIGMENNTMAQMPWYEHLVLGGFCFGAVFMATDPVTSARTERGKYIFGFLIGVMAIVIRVLNPGYPEGMMLAILLMNIFAPLIDYCVVQSNISRREKRAVKSNQ